MIQTIKNNIKSLLITAALLVPVMVPAVAHAQIQEGLCNGVSLSTNGGDQGSCANGEEATTKVNDLIALIINIFSIVVGVVSVIMIIVGGLKYITSAGDSNNVTSAKNTILYAVIGLVVVALAQFIVQFVLAKTISGSDSV